MIQIEDLCFAYDSREVLHNVNIHVKRGDFAIMVGPNGGGKTTLLRLILGLLKPLYGSITVLGTDPVSARSRISYVPQSLQYDEKLPVTVLDVVLMGRVASHFWGSYNRKDKEIARDALDKVRLSGLESRPFKALSGGQRQRVLVAQALASSPELMLLDEPGASLDPENRLALCELLHSLNKDITILMVSHNLNVIASVASHVICVNNTAVCHPVEEVRTDALVNGAWTHLTHKDCPVDSMDRADTPHNAIHHKH